MHSVSRTASSRVLLPRSLFKRIARDASVPASGATAAEFARMLPRPSTSSVTLRSVASEYGTSPRNALRRAFLTIRRAAAAKKCRRIAGRLAQIAGQLAGPKRSLDRRGKTAPGAGKEPQVKSTRRLQ